MAKSALGRGLSSLMPDSVEDAKAQGDMVLQIPLSNLIANPDQPRKEFKTSQIEELASSIREKGIIQPLVAEGLTDGRYMIIAGERRFRAARLAGLDQVPIVVRNFTEEEKLEIGLIENIQREDLNAIEEANGYRSLMDRFGFTQDAVAKKLGKSRSAVANALRLLQLPEAVQKAISNQQISAGHARALLSIDPDFQDQSNLLFEKISSDGLSVRATERAARMINDGLSMSELEAQSVEEHTFGNDETERLRREVIELASGAKSVAKGTQKSVESGTSRSPEIWAMEEALIRKTGTKAEIRGDDSSGRIEIHYYSPDDLKRLYDLLIGD